MGIWSVGVLVLLYFGLITIQVNIWAVVILPPLLLLLLIAFRKNGKYEGSDQQDELMKAVSAWRYVTLMYISGIAAVVYGISLLVDLRLHTNIVSTFLGAGLYAVSIFMVFRGKKPDKPVLK